METLLASELLASLESRGISLTTIADGTRIEVEPGSKLTAADRAGIRGNKQALLALLAAREASALAEAQAAVAAMFTRSKFVGSYLKGAFNGPMLRILDSPHKCPKCGGRKHFRIVDGKPICAICADGGTRCVAGDKFQDALVDSPTGVREWPCPSGEACTCTWCHRPGVIRCGACNPGRNGRG